MTLRRILLGFMLMASPAIADETRPTPNAPPDVPVGCSNCTLIADSSRLLMSEFNGKVTFYWPEIQACAADNLDKYKGAEGRGQYRAIIDCRVWLAARHAGFTEADPNKADPMPTIPIH